jgi:hypothetical protein
MTAQRDPYPDDLAPVDYGAPQPVPTFEAELLRVLNRIAAALEHSAPANVTISPPRALAPLPPVTTVPQKPPCPFHGFDKVQVSTKGSGGFYCSAKAAPGQPANARGYCTWQS